MATLAPASITATTTNAITCAVEVFIATALLHAENPLRVDFTIQEIVARAAMENLHGSLRPGVHVHASQHCVANRQPNPLRYRMLYATGKHTRRLLRPGDESHPARTGKVFPQPDELPAKYLELLHWAEALYKELGEDVYAHGKTDQATSPGKGHLSGLYELIGLGKELWQGIDPDEYVRQLREGWE